MPIYNNKTPASQGNEYIKIPPKTINFKSIYFYDIPHVTRIDSKPFYNPVLFKKIINYNNINNYEINLNNNLIGQDTFLFIQVNSKNSKSITDVELIFNNIDNLPSLPIANSIFSINNNHRINKIFINTINSAGEIIIMITDKFIPSFPSIPYNYKP